MNLPLSEEINISHFVSQRSPRGHFHLLLDFLTLGKCISISCTNQSIDNVNYPVNFQQGYLLFALL